MWSFIRKNKTCVIIFGHIIMVAVGYCLIQRFGGYNFAYPNQDNLLHFDAYWYFSIKQFGYEYQPDVGNNLAFFPLFPLVWDVSGLSEVLICAFNYFVFAGSFVFLLRREKLHYSFIFMLLSFPSFIFFALPYSESLFFLFGVIIIFGFKKQSMPLLCVGFFAASLVRSVCLIFIPALVIWTLINLNSGKSVKQRLTQLFLPALSSVCGLFIAMLYVHYETDTWFYFIKIQKYWHRHWLTPIFPLTTISPERISGLDAITFMVGILGIIYCLIAFISTMMQSFKTTVSLNFKADPEVLFSALYISGMTILDTCFTYNKNGLTSIWSLNRHVMCTPFAIIFLIYLFKDFQPKLYLSMGIMITILTGLFFTGVYKFHSLPTLFFYLLFFATFFLLKKTSSFNRYFFLYYIIALFLQMEFYNDFLSSRWVG